MDSSNNIFEGRTTNEAIEKGLQTLGISKEDAEIKVLEDEDKRSFFSILTPRAVKVEIKIKEKKIKERAQKPKEELEKIDFKTAISNVDSFLKEWIKELPTKEVNYKIQIEDFRVKVDIDGNDLNYLIGHRGDVLNNFQTILSAIASKSLGYKVKVILNICGYKEKREKSLEELADKLAKTVVRTRKSITLEPMTAYERKIIHSKLQSNDKVKTDSVGEEPYRKVVISLK